MSKTIIIGTRGSALALWQTNWIKSMLEEAGFEVQIKKIQTEGDKVLDTPLPLFGGKGVFTKALDDALLEKSIDIAVHSMKDVPTILPEGLSTCAITERADFRDALVVKNGFNQNEKAIIATGSNRRKAQWLEKHPNHSAVDIRGNVPTRIEKVRSGEYGNATILAAAGLKRLELEHEVFEYLDWMLPAPAQGAVSVMCKSGFRFEKELNEVLHHKITANCVTAERDFLNFLEGGCSAPLGALCTFDGEKYHFHAKVLSLDGQQCIEVKETINVEEVSMIGRKMGKIALEKGADKLLQ